MPVCSLLFEFCFHRRDTFLNLADLLCLNIQSFSHFIDFQFLVIDNGFGGDFLLFERFHILHFIVYGLNEENCSLVCFFKSNNIH